MCGGVCSRARVAYVLVVAQCIILAFFLPLWPLPRDMAFHREVNLAPAFPPCAVITFDPNS